MNFIDILLIIPLAYAAWKGFKKGLIIEVFTLLALLVGIYAGIHFSDWTSEMIADFFDITPNYLPVIAFTLTFLAIGAMVYFAGKMLEQMVKVVNLSPINKILGVLFGLLKMLYTISIFLILIETYDQRGNFFPEELKEKSLLYSPIKATASATIPAVQESAIWVKEAMNNDWLENDNDVTLKDLMRLKEVADSLGIEPSDVQEYLQNN
ncbi:MAG: CvpA family protein [Crocinitomicaceae bacterium]|jgi:membrane protein required for colicin V production|nr:CvpA family protein [Crocinitomicaceae bacterium]